MKTKINTFLQYLEHLLTDLLNDTKAKSSKTEIYEPFPLYEAQALKSTNLH